MAIIDSSVRIRGEEVKLYVEVQDQRKPMRAFGQEEDVESKAISRRQDVIGEGLNVATNCTRRVIDSLQGMDDLERPDTFGVSFGIKLDTEAGPVITNNRTGAQLQVTMSWKKPGQDKE